MDYYNQWLLDSTYDEKRFCYARARQLRDAVKDGAALDAVIQSLGVPSTATSRRKLSEDKKRQSIEKHITHLRSLPTSEWHKCPPAEVFAGALYSSKGASQKASVFFPVARENELYSPVATWLQKQKLTVYGEIPMGTARADVVGYLAEGFFATERIVTVELKNSLADMKRGLDQMSTYADYSHEVYLACTPALAAAYLKSHCQAAEVLRWDPAVLERKLKRLGFGLLMVEDDAVFELQTPRANSPVRLQLKELRPLLQHG